MSDTDNADSSYRVTADEIRQFFERIERLESEKKDITEQIREIFSEAKGRGYDTAAMREVLKLRKKDSDARSEFEAVVDMYKEAVGM